MTSPSNKVDERKYTLFVCGIVVTFIYLAGTVWLRWSYGKPIGIGEIFRLDLNELGDFFAGVFAPLAFFWFILAFIQQQKELQQNTEALQAQAREFKESVKHQKELAIATNRQTDVDEATLKLEEKRENSRLLPDLVLTRCSPSRAPDIIRWEIEFINYGAVAYDVSFYMSRDVGPTAKPLPRSAYLLQGESLTVQVDLNRTDDTIKGQLEVLINYKNTRLREHIKSFLLKMNDEGYFIPYNITESESSILDYDISATPLSYGETYTYSDLSHMRFTNKVQ